MLSHSCLHPRGIPSPGARGPKDAAGGAGRAVPRLGK